MATYTQPDIINAQTNAKFEIQDAKFNAFMEEMRIKDNQRVEDMREIRTSISSMNKHVRNLTITAMIGIGAMAITVIYSVFSTIPK